jgi:hypothetical protein
MKIIFLCGSLEPGRDGVGDYVRRLACELIKQGHQIAAVALNDHYLVEEFTGTQPANDITLPVYRIPTAWPENKRFDRAREWIKNNNPDWLSLQYVPFAFHTKGLSISLSRQLHKLGEGKCWHIMFHELWVGMDSEASIKVYCWGLVQRFLIKSLILTLKPKVIHTQTQLYIFQLAKLGFTAVYLPLFSNIPRINKSYQAIKHSENNIISFVVFASIQPGAPIRQFAEEVAIYSRENNKKVLIIFIGRCGKEQDHWVSECKSSGLEIKLLGEQPTEYISEVLHNATFGISTTPLAQIEKSGAVAAMRDHGIPVLCIARSWHPRGIIGLDLPYGVIEYKQGNLKECLLIKKDTLYSYDVSEVSKQYVNSLLVKSHI